MYKVPRIKDGMIVVGAGMVSLACATVLGALWVWGAIRYSALDAVSMLMGGLWLLTAGAAWAGWRGRTDLAVLLPGIACIPGCYFLFANTIFVLVGVATFVQLLAGVVLEIRKKQVEKAASSPDPRSGRIE